jgi:anti-sigma regulatory factor (Ser/Thr protein kinase)
MAVTVMEDLDWTALPTRSLAGSWRILLGSCLEKAELPAGLTGDILLVAGELINNAVEHGPADELVALQVRSGVSWVRIGVWDAGNTEPHATPTPDLDGDLDEILATLEENGRGLQIVMALSAESGFDWTPPKGKYTWARFHF